ncbi:RDD family protein, partial [Burkholderia pseudomallei]
HPLAGFPLPRTLAATAVWFALWALAARLHPSRQFPHDRLAGTRIVDAPRRG